MAKKNLYVLSKCLINLSITTLSITLNKLIPRIVLN